MASPLSDPRWPQHTPPAARPTESKWAKPSGIIRTTAGPISNRGGATSGARSAECTTCTCIAKAVCIRIVDPTQQSFSSRLIYHHCVYTCMHDQASVGTGGMKRGRKGSSQIAIDTYTPRSWKDRNPITSQYSTLMVESMACKDCSTTL